MTNYLLFSSTVLIWGTTWIAIALQIGPVPVLVSVFYRFAAAALILVGALILTRRMKVPPLRQQPFILAQALCLFCCNFLCFYYAAAYVPSGLISVVFSLATIFNAVNARIFFGDRVSPRTLLAAMLGATGLVLLFGPDIFVAFNPDSWKGVGLSALGTLFFSFGNMASRRNSAAGISPVTANAWGMSYGALTLLGLVLITATPVVMPPDITYLGALLYLSVVGSVVGFTTYLMLVSRIGSQKAAYATVLFPVVALTLSSIYEDYRWTAISVAGLLLTLAGNVVMFVRLPIRAKAIGAEPGRA
ncbi:threonine/homoserine efflux transporter RhtA [Ciceribacter lividus]|uniref:Threonine/homoserine efflux transporter RhtA n=1 Tax=Ciceribacter lividus TaxID=1197950 RepID=A0A6I7HL71_9HYPH|nr:DMT family transporter [Ciceribacter lividus]RCW23246.1 threonine/homoserine efflux transporter RhtA [Ciceribacter lividus]